MKSDSLFLHTESKYGVINAHFKTKYPVATREIIEVEKLDTFPPLSLIYADLTREDQLETWIKRIREECKNNKDLHVLTLLTNQNTKVFHSQILKHSKEITFVYPSNLLLVLWQGEPKSMPIIHSFREDLNKADPHFNRINYLKRRALNDFWEKDENC